MTITASSILDDPCERMFRRMTRRVLLERVFKIFNNEMIAFIFIMCHS